MASPAVEQKVFDAFVALRPNFAGRPVQCARGANPPDFTCVDSGGAQIGVELSEWLHETQIARERPRYQLEREYRQAIDSRRVSPPANIGGIWLWARRRLSRSDERRFCTELYALVSQLDSNWTQVRDHDNPHGAVIRDFSGYPIVAKYLSSLMCWSHLHRTAQLGHEWITFMPHGGAHGIQPAIQALEFSLQRKTAMYATLKSNAGLAELHLLLYYDQGWAFNTPFDAPGFGFREIASHLKQVASADHGAFDRIFLFIPAKQQLETIY